MSNQQQHFLSVSRPQHGNTAQPGYSCQSSHYWKQKSMEGPIEFKDPSTGELSAQKTSSPRRGMLKRQTAVDHG
ncbi:hypothetical protein AOLI_G00185650 [Acnodon oligacanthus]